MFKSINSMFKDDTEMEICSVKLYDMIFLVLLLPLCMQYLQQYIAIFFKCTFLFLIFFCCCINLFTHCLGTIQVILTAYDIVVITEETH